MIVFKRKSRMISFRLSEEERQSHPAHHVEAYPQAPGELIAQVGGAAQPVHHAQVGGIQPAQHNGREDCAPDGNFRKLQLHLRRPSFLATSARRLVIQQIPPNSTVPVETTSGTSSNTRQVVSGNASIGTLVRSPICSNGAAER